MESASGSSLMTVGIFSGLCIRHQKVIVATTFGAPEIPVHATKKADLIRSAFSCCDALRDAYAENDDPQPHPPVAFGFLNVKPEPCIDVV
jgi:hypothetical protein